MTEKQQLRDKFDIAMRRNRCIAVEVDLPDCPLAETILIPFENLKAKLAYYEKAYDDELKLKANPEVSIVDAFIYREDDLGI